MKRYFKNLFLYMVICLCFCGCGNNTNQDDEKITLTDTEQIMMDRILDDMEFYNHQEIKFLDGYYGEYDPNGDIDGYVFYVKISSTNAIGGTLTECYYIPDNDYRDLSGGGRIHLGITKQEDVSRCNYSKQENNNFNKLDVAKLNKYLKQYWAKLGIE